MPGPTLAAVSRTASFGHEPAKECIGKGFAAHPFRVPLYTNNPARSADPFDRFDNSVRSICGYAQPSSGIPNGLVVRAIDTHVGMASQLRQAAVFNAYRMTRAGAVSTGSVLDSGVQLARNVLDQAPVQMNIEQLRAVANGQDRLVGSQCVVEQQIVSVLAPPIWLGSLCVASAAIAARIHICGAAR